MKQTRAIYSFTPPPTDADFDCEDVDVILTEGEAPMQWWPLGVHLRPALPIVVLRRRVPGGGWPTQHRKRLYLIKKGEVSFDTSQMYFVYVLLSTRIKC